MIELMILNAALIGILTAMPRRESTRSEFGRRAAKAVLRERGPGRSFRHRGGRSAHVRHV